MSENSREPLAAYFEAAQLLLNHNFNEAISRYNTLLTQPDVPRWLKTGIYSDLAVAYLSINDSPQALESFEQAVANGFNDYFSLSRNPIWKRIAGESRFKEAYSKIRILPVEAHELLWLHTEIQTVLNETSMMITENINRKDNQYTVVTQVAIPAHASGPSVLMAREVLRFLHAFQKNKVFEADSNRIIHLVQAQAIASIRTPSYDEQWRKQMEEQESARQARLRATHRMNACQSRQFQIPANLTTEPQPLPPLE